MSSFIEVGNIIIRTGTRLEANERAAVISMCPAGTRVSVVQIRKEMEIRIGIFSETRQKTWHDLEGVVPQGHGFWIGPDTLAACFTLIHKTYEVCAPNRFRGLDLQNRKCEILFDIRLPHADLVMVEFQEFVGGGSGDGLGKSGHCLAVSCSSLKEVSERKITSFLKTEES